MTTMTQLQSVHVNAGAQFVESADVQAVSDHLIGRLIQIMLTLYLLPAFLVVFVVGGVGIVVLKINRILKDLSEKRAY
jgi:hypothetical protein